MRRIIALTMMALALLAACPPGDKSPPSPHLIVLNKNVLSIYGLSDPCKVKSVEVIVNNYTIYSASPDKESVNLVVTLPSKTPMVLVIRYSDGKGNKGGLTWTVRYLPYVPYTLETMVVSNGKGVVMVNPPPNKPALPPAFGDPAYQTGAWILMASLAFVLGLIRYAYHKLVQGRMSLKHTS